jgi:peptidylprolyl isomerase
MKFTLPVIMLAGALLVQSAGCSSNGGDSTTAPTAAQTQPQSTPVADTSLPPGAAGPQMAQSVSAVPKTTVVDGKTVKLKSLADGLEYYDIKVGTGPHPKVGQTVSVQYTGTLLDGTKFDSSYDHGGTPIDFPIGVGQVIKGWDEGVPPMKVGGKRRLVIPADLAYGDNPPTASIPPGATLIFDIELVAVK